MFDEIRVLALFRVTPLKMYSIWISDPTVPVGPRKKAEVRGIKYVPS
jgi:hypothetical protein